MEGGGKLTATARRSSRRSFTIIHPVGKKSCFMAWKKKRVRIESCSLLGGLYWIRTSDLMRVKHAL